jgi:hypothetical protein
VRHARDAALDLLEPLLREIRAIEGLVERKRGIWHRGSRAFLHFHEDPAGLFADLRVGADFVRFRVSGAGERRAFLRALRKALSGAAGEPPRGARARPRRRAGGR